MSGYITSEDAKLILKMIRSHTLSNIVSEEALLKCFHTIRDMLPILNERAAMDCVCLNMDFCSCGKSQAARILRQIKQRPQPKRAYENNYWKR